MESLKNTLDELTAHFNTRMSEFQKELKGTIPTTSPSSAINIQFNSFRAFVLTALENLQLQVEFLSRQYDELEMRTRKKILLLHGVPETNKEDLVACAAQLLSAQLKIPQVVPASFSRCHRLGHNDKDKPRALLIKFNDLALRNQVWSAKTKLKGTGVTMSEFLTKPRHKAFLAARQRFGVTKCWTRDGVIVVLSADGSKHRITSAAELNAISGSGASASGPVVMPAALEVTKSSKIINPRTKRVLKK